MTPSKPPHPGDQLTGAMATGPGWTRRELDIFARRLSGRAPRATGDDHAVPPPPHVRDSAPASRRPWRLTGRVAAIALFACTLFALLMAALTSADRDDPPATRVVRQPPTDAPAPPSAAASARADPTEPATPPAAADPGEAAVRAFYVALGRADGAAASALVIPEKRSTRAYAPGAISRFYGSLREPLRLTAVTPLAPGSYRVRYRYAAGAAPCDGEAVVTLAARDGQELIRSIRALNGC